MLTHKIPIGMCFFLFHFPTFVWCYCIWIWRTCTRFNWRYVICIHHRCVWGVKVWWWIYFWWNELRRLWCHLKIFTSILHSIYIGFCGRITIYLGEKTTTSGIQLVFWSKKIENVLRVHGKRKVSGKNIFYSNGLGWMVKMLFSVWWLQINIWFSFDD